MPKFEVPLTASATVSASLTLVVEAANKDQALKKAKDLGYKSHDWDINEYGYSIDDIELDEDEDIQRLDENGEYIEEDEEDEDLPAIETARGTMNI